MSAAAGTGGAAPIKILLVGPSKSRKSPLACMLAGQCDAITAINPGPTVGVRILELDRSGVAVELWDVAGDQSYEATWPAVMKDADGVLLVYNPEAPAAAKEAELWTEWFVVKPGIKNERVLAIALGGDGPAASLATGIAHERLPVEGGEDAIRKAFDRFVARLAVSVRGR